MRQSVVRILALLPVIDKRILPAKVAVVEEAARRLAVEDRGLEILRLAVKGKFRSIGFSAMMRSVAHYWSPTGKMRLRDWLDMLRNFLPPVPGLYMIGDQALLARFRALGQLPNDTLGYALYRFYTDRGFALPGEPKSFPEGWAKHEAYHVLSEYEVNDQGEMLLAAFSGGNSRLLCMDLLMVTLLQFQAGKRVVPGPIPVDELRPAAFFRALARGASMNVDLLGGQWTLWPVVERPIAELRTAYNVSPLSAAGATRAQRLAGADRVGVLPDRGREPSATLRPCARGPARRVRARRSSGRRAWAARGAGGGGSAPPPGRDRTTACHRSRPRRDGA